jgi:hypothetical protein
MFKILCVTTASIGLAAGLVQSQPEKHAEHAVAPQPAASPAAKAFEWLKGLAGEWRGKASHEGEPIDAAVTYRVTAAGSAVVEALFPGTEHEMVTVYTRDGDSLLLTHYCSMGNQPRMRCKPGADPDKLDFEFIDGGNMASADEPHMHALTLRFQGADTLTASWSMYAGGKLQNKAKFELERVKPAAHGSAHDDRGGR